MDVGNGALEFARKREKRICDTLELQSVNDDEDSVKHQRERLRICC